MTKKMTALTISRYKQKQLTKETLPISTILHDEVLVEIHAASINPIDFKIRDGKLRPLLSYKMPLVLGNDFAGVVTEVGDQVTRFKVGDHVYGRPRKSKIGTFAEYIGVHQDDIALMPRNLNFEEAASLPLVALTSYQALHEIMDINPQEKVLIQAGAGGIGTIAIQLAKHFGAYVATTASPKGFDLVTDLGADKIINYREEDFEKTLSDYDYVFDTLGGDALKKAFTIVKPQGKIVSITALPNKRFAKTHPISFFKKMLFTIVSYPLSRLEKKHHVEYHFLFMKPSGEQLTLISNLVETGIIRPVIDKVYNMSDYQTALDYVEAGRAKGKVIIKIK